MNVKLGSTKIAKKKDDKKADPKKKDAKKKDTKGKKKVPGMGVYKPVPRKAPPAKKKEIGPGKAQQGGVSDDGGVGTTPVPKAAPSKAAPAAGTTDVPGSKTEAPEDIGGYPGNMPAVTGREIARAMRERYTGNVGDHPGDPDVIARRKHMEAASAKAKAEGKTVLTGAGGLGMMGNFNQSQNLSAAVAELEAAQAKGMGKILADESGKPILDESGLPQRDTGPGWWRRNISSRYRMSPLFRLLGGKDMTATEALYGGMGDAPGVRSGMVKRKYDTAAKKWLKEKEEKLAVEAQKELAVATAPGADPALLSAYMSKLDKSPAHRLVREQYILAKGTGLGTLGGVPPEQQGMSANQLFGMGDYAGGGRRDVVRQPKGWGPAGSTTKVPAVTKAPVPTPTTQFRPVGGEFGATPAPQPRPATPVPGTGTSVPAAAPQVGQQPVPAKAAPQQQPVGQQPMPKPPVMPVSQPAPGQQPLPTGGQDLYQLAMSTPEGRGIIDKRLGIKGPSLRGGQNPEAVAFHDRALQNSMGGTQPATTRGGQAANRMFVRPGPVKSTGFAKTPTPAPATPVGATPKPKPPIKPIKPVEPELLAST